MNVAVLTNLFPNVLEPSRSTFNEQQILALNQVLPVVSIIVPVDWRRVLKFKREGHLDTLRDKTNWGGVAVSYPTYFYIPKVASWLNGLLMFLSLLPQWLRVKQQRPEVIYATWAFPDGFAAVLLGKLSGIRVVIKVHGSDVEILAKERLRRTLAVWALNRASAVISVSAYLRDMLVDLGVEQKKLRVIYNGIDQQKFRPLDREECRQKLGLSNTKKIILYVGNLKSDKGVVDLLNAFVPITGGDGNVELTYAGDGESRAEIEQLTALHGISATVRLLGKISHDSLPFWINAADVVCLPSHHEGVPNVLLEAAACGTPCVATIVGGIPEVVTPASGLLVAHRDVPALTTALIEALRREWDRNKVQTALKLSIGSWAQNAGQLASVLRGDRV
jgi:glycosyltransferase involved in cell wall biosynthesis